VARDGDELVVVTDAGSGKAKRIRNNGHVEVAPCDVRGRISGASVSGNARLMDSSGTAYIEAQIKRKYGAQYTAIGLMEKLRRWEAGGSVGIRIDVDTSGIRS
jgi:PPOX class probable F420-dependent enzyme, Rv2061 family